MIATFVLSLVLAFAQPSGSFEFTHAERVTGDVPVVCLASRDFHAWARQAGMNGFPTNIYDGAWDVRNRTIILGIGDCRMITHWRKQVRYGAEGVANVRDAVWSLGHEYRHSQQHGGEGSYNMADEADADCWSARHLASLARGLGIKRQLPRVPNACR